MKLQIEIPVPDSLIALLKKIRSFFVSPYTLYRLFKYKATYQAVKGFKIHKGDTHLYLIEKGTVLKVDPEGYTNIRDTKCVIGPAIKAGWLVPLFPINDKWRKKHFENFSLKENIISYIVVIGFKAPVVGQKKATTFLAKDMLLKVVENYTLLEGVKLDLAQAIESGYIEPVEPRLNRHSHNSMLIQPTPEQLSELEVKFEALQEEGLLEVEDLEMIWGKATLEPLKEKGLLTKDNVKDERRQECLIPFDPKDEDPTEKGQLTEDIKIN